MNNETTSAEFLPDCYRQVSDNKTDATSSAVLSLSFSLFAENPLTSSSSIDWRIQALRQRRHDASARAGRRACAAARAASAKRSRMTATRAVRLWLDTCTAKVARVSFAHSNL